MLTIEPFALERYFARYEFSARHLLSCSDCEALTMASLIALADDKTRKMWSDLKLGYTDSLGHPGLRRAIADIYSGFQTEDVLVAAPEENIFLLMQALLSSGDHVICTFPGYQSLYAVARSIGCRVSLWTGDESQGWRFDIGRLAQMIEERTRLVVVNFPHNPTGYLPTREEFEDLVDLLRERHIHLLSDEMYRFLETDAVAPLPAACELYEKAVSLSGLSKSFGLPGLRIGWSVSRDHKLLNAMAGLKDYTTICSSAPSEILAIMALENRKTIVTQQKTRLKKNAAVLDAFWHDYRDYIKGRSPRAGTLCFPRMEIVADTYRFCEELVRDAGIMLVPSRMFAYGDHHVRIGFGRENFPEVLSRFGEYLRSRFG